MIKQQYRKLQDYPFVRVRTEIYLGSREPVTQSLVYFDGTKLGMREFTYVPALLTYFREMLDNALDEVIGRNGGHNVHVEYNPQTMDFAIEDDGRGIPIEHDAGLGGIPAVVLLSEVQAGSNFDDQELARVGYISEKDVKGGSRGNWSGVNGVGGSVVNFVSEMFEIQVWRDQKHFTQRWTEGKSELKTDGHFVFDTFTKKHGTRVSFRSSRKVFPDLTLPEDLIRSHLWMVAASNVDRVKLFLNGTQLKVERGRDAFSELILDGFSFIPVEIDHPDFKATYYLVEGFAAGSETIYSIVNNVPTYNGGSHIETFRTAFYRELRAELDVKLKKEKISVSREDISSGLLILNVTTMAAPTFDAQSKSKLQNTNINPIIRESITAERVARIVRQNPKWIEAIIERCRDRTNRRVVQDQKKAAQEKPAKLKDATGRDRLACILFVAEGDSAIDSGLQNVRDARIHGGLPLMGKVANTHSLKMSMADVAKSKVYSDIMTALGLRLGQKAMRGMLRYGRCYIATDEDDDGQHITNLLTMFFFRFWPELFDSTSPFFFKFCTPFVIARKGSRTKYFYEDEYKTDFEPNIEKYHGWDITRAKGLGQLRKTDWEHAIKENRIIPIINDGDPERGDDLSSILDLLFNPKRADDRKVWLSNDEH